jgi:hypothetical protein
MSKLTCSSGLAKAQKSHSHETSKNESIILPFWQKYALSHRMRESLVVHTLRYLLAVGGFTMTYLAAF